ncbi:hypothetical protein FA95DRAFT_1599610, partial [Auriscalpium vulgare]
MVEGRRRREIRSERRFVGSGRTALPTYTAAHVASTVVAATTTVTYLRHRRMGIQCLRMDHTREINRRGCNFDVNGTFNHLQPLGQTVPTSSLGAEALPPFLRRRHSIPLVNSYPRGHYRFVFEEVGLPLYKDAAYGAVFSTLRDALVGLGAMHKYGLMHGD